MSFKLFALCLLAFLMCTAHTVQAEDGNEDSSSLWSAWDRAKSAWNHLKNSNHGEGWEDVKASLGHLGAYFKDKFQDAREFIAENQDDLMPKVRATMEFLNSMRRKIDDIDEKADPAFQSVVQKVKGWMGITQDMEMRIENGKEDPEALRREWKAQAQRMYSEGLGDVVTYAKAEALTSASPSPHSQIQPMIFLLLSMFFGLLVFW